MIAQIEGCRTMSDALWLASLDKEIRNHRRKAPPLAAAITCESDNDVIMQLVNTLGRP